MNKTPRLTTAFALSFSLFTVSFSAVAQDEATSRDVKLQDQAAARALQINQVDTSRYPKVDIFTTILENGEPVLGLAASDFKVREDEVEQEPLTVEAQRSPLSIALTLDTSGSMSKAISTAKVAAKSFVDTLEPSDSFAVLSFARSVQILAPIGADKEKAKTSIEGTVARGDTALFDALYSSIETLKSRPGRRAVVLLSDGVDDDGTGKPLSTHKLPEVLEAAAKTNIPVFVIGLGKELDEKTLKEVAEKSGGAFYVAPNAEDLGKLYAGLGKQLTGQYQISYTSNLPSDGSLHRIQLGQGAQKSVKEFTAPATGGVKAAPTAAPAAPAPTLAPAPVGGPVEIELSASFETAPQIVPRQTYRFKVPKGSTGDVSLYATFDAPSGTNVIGLFEGVGNYCCPEIELLDNAFVARAKTYDTAGKVMRVRTLTAHEGGGKGYIRLKSQDGGTFSIQTSDRGDAGASRDAGASDAEALEVAVSAEVDGFLDGYSDVSDSYRVALQAGQEYEVKARPDTKSQVTLEVFDADGVELKQSNSPNDGAVAKVAFKVESAGTYLVVVKPPNSSGFGSYRLVVGPKGVSSPGQPKVSPPLASAQLDGSDPN